MHLVFYARGILSEIEKWKLLMQNHFFKFRVINPEGKEEVVLVQGALRPSVLGAWEYVFPKEALAEVISMMCLEEGNIGTVPSKALDFKLGFLRKIFGVKKIPKKVWEEARSLPPSIMLTDRERGISHALVKGVSIHIIGIKEDEYRYFTENGYTQEAL